MSEEVARYSTREIVADTQGMGPRKLGHNPSWVKAVHYDALLAQSLPDCGHVTRLEIISESGRLLSLRDVTITFALQDDGRTLKVFVVRGQ